VRINSIRVADRAFLLVHGSGGTAHLAEEVDEGGRAAFDDDDFQGARRRGFTGEARELQAPRWSPKALCGNEWGCMSPTEETSAFFWFSVEEVAAPECKKCLRKLDALFPQPTAAPAVNILAELAADQVVEHGSAEIYGVPADQVEVLRKQAKKAVRSRGFPSRTVQKDDLVLIYSDAAYEAIPLDVRLARDRVVAETMGIVLEGGQPPPREMPWRLHWSTWDV
jgi:hypothetical protein